MQSVTALRARLRHLARKAAAHPTAQRARRIGRRLAGRALGPIEAGADAVERLRDLLARQAPSQMPRLPGLRHEHWVSAAKAARIDANWQALAEDLATRRARFSSRPLLLEFSTNNRCNLRCPMCRPEPRSKWALPQSVVTGALIGELLPAARVLTPSSGSEPFLGDFELLAAACVRHEVQLNLITNGTLMTPHRLEAAAPVIGRLQVSFDAHRKELYEAIRVGARFERVARNVGQAAELARKHGFELMLSAVFSRELAPELPSYVRFAAELGADAVVFQKMHPLTPQAVEMDAFRVMEPAAIERVMNAAIRAAEEEGIDIHFAFDPPQVRNFNRRQRRRLLADEPISFIPRCFPRFCYMAATYMHVEADGSVYPCCVPHPAIYMGNLTEAPLEAVWNGPRYRRLRRAMFAGRYPAPCRSCIHLKRGRWAEQGKV